MDEAADPTVQIQTWLDRIPPAERQKVAGDYGAQAVQMLRRMQTAGHLEGPKRLAKLRDSPILAPLLGREDFQALLKELEEKVKPEKE
jgi:hypothetical protein